MNQQDHPITRLAIKAIRSDTGIQQRARIDENLYLEYAETINAWIENAPICVFDTGDGEFLCADGFHRIEASIEAGLKEIPAIVRKGTRRDAILYACQANKTHGARRTRSDVRKAIVTLLSDPEWCAWSNRLIAEKIGTTDKTVAAVRQELAIRCGNSAPAPTTRDDAPVIEEITQADLTNIKTPWTEKRTGRDGKSYPTTSKPKPKTTTPPSAVKAKPTATPKVNKPKVALDASLALSAAIARLRPLVPDLLPEDARASLVNLKGILDLIETTFGKEGKGHA